MFIKKILIILLLMMIFVLEFGYSKYVDAMKIDGIANAVGNFDIQFDNAILEKAVGVNRNQTFATITADNKYLNVNVADLSYPGAYAKFSVDICNKGTIPAKAEILESNGINSGKAIKIINLENINSKDEVLMAGQTKKVYFIIKWDPNYYDDYVSEDLSFKLKINYSQALY